MPAPQSRTEGHVDKGKHGLLASQCWLEDPIYSLPSILHCLHAVECFSHSVVLTQATSEGMSSSSEVFAAFKTKCHTPETLIAVWPTSTVLSIDQVDQTQIETGQQRARLPTPAARQVCVPHPMEFG